MWECEKTSSKTMFLGMIQFVLSRHASDRAVGFLENFFEFSQNRDRVFGNDPS